MRRGPSHSKSVGGGGRRPRLGHAIAHEVEPEEVKATLALVESTHHREVSPRRARHRGEEVAMHGGAQQNTC